MSYSGFSSCVISEGAANRLIKREIIAGTSLKSCLLFHRKAWSGMIPAIIKSSQKLHSELLSFIDSRLMLKCVKPLGY